MEPAHSKPGWDVRAWRVGLIASNTTGLIVAVCFENAVQTWARRYNAGAYSGVSIVAVLSSMVVLPGVLAGIARRRWLMWAYLPLFTMLCWMIATYALDIVLKINDITSGSGSAAFTKDDWPGVLMFFCAPLTTALPVTLVRLRLAALQARRAARLAFEEAQYTMERVGVWPPPPSAVVPKGDVPEDRSYL